MIHKYLGASAGPHVYFSDAESNPAPECVKGKGLRWDGIKKFSRHHVEQFVLDLDMAASS